MSSKARELANLGNAYSDGALSNRNLIINGAMQVWQRGTASVTVGTGGDFLADRFQMWQGTDGVTTAEQSSEAPDGFGYSLKLSVSTADTSLAASQYMQLGYYLEAQDLQQFGYGTSEAKTITFSFYVRSSKTGTYVVSLRKPDNTSISFIKEYTIDAANTWERKVITIEPDANIKASGGAINNDNGAGFNIYWNLAMGSAYTVGTDNAWSTNTNAYSTTNVDNWMDSTSNDFYLTGVQLEVGDTATPFEHRSYGQELALCQRYYYAENAAGHPSPTSGQYHRFDGVQQNVNEFNWYPQYPVPMRATPSLVKNNLSSSTIEVFNATSQTSPTFTNMVSAEGGINSGQIRVQTNGTINNGDVGSWRWAFNANASVGFDAEL